jgi:hypothetical protein
MVLEIHDWLGRVLQSVQTQSQDLAVSIIDVRRMIKLVAVDGRLTRIAARSLDRRVHTLFTA